jgi:hypothetical protein
LTLVREPLNRWYVDELPTISTSLVPSSLESG